MASTTDEDLAERVMAVIADQIGLSRKAMTLQSRVEEDFGCSGEDAVELMERLQREFRIDMSGFEFSRHFDGGGGAWPFAAAGVVAFPLSILAMHVIGIATALAGFAGAGFLQAGWFFVVVYFGCFAVIKLATTLLPSERARRAAKVPVTLQLLVEAAQTRRWPAAVSERHTS